jgi:hypothetical protein
MSYKDNGPRNAVTWLVLVPPELGGNDLTNGVPSQPHGVHGEFFGVARSRSRNP